MRSFDTVTCVCCMCHVSHFPPGLVYFFLSSIIKLYRCPQTTVLQSPRVQPALQSNNLGLLLVMQQRLKSPPLLLHQLQQQPGRQA